MGTAFIIGNGESRAIFPINELKNKGIIYGCNAIYRDYPTLCDKIVSVNPEMSIELDQARKNNKIPKTTRIYSTQNLPIFNYILPDDKVNDADRFWYGSDPKSGTSKTHDFAKNRGSGCSAIQLACNDGNTKIFIIGFDILGARQWELAEGLLSRRQNNMYKDSINYPNRQSMKAYLKYEWIYQLKQIARYYHDKSFYFINRLEYLEENILLHQAMKNVSNFKYGIYADLMRFIADSTIRIKWRRY